MINGEINDELIKISNNICLKFKNDGEVKGLIKTSYSESPTPPEFLLIKHHLKILLSKLDTNYYIDDIELKFGTYSRSVIFNTKHEWDGVGMLFSFGLMIPILLPGIIVDLYEYFNTTNYNYIEYNIKKRKSNVIVV